MLQNSKNLYMRQSLVNMAISKPVKKEVKEKAPHHSIKWTDEQVLEIRALHAFAGWKPARLADHYGLKVSAVNGILSYHNRVRLEPTPDHVPSFAK